MKRRVFLQSLCAAGVTLMTGCKSTPTYHQVSKQGNKLVISKSLLDSNGRVSVSHNNLNIGIVQASLNSYSAAQLTCTHMGCGIEADDNGFICPCHGARFTKLGKVVKGPAKTNLTRFITSSDDNNIYVHLSETVSAL